MIKHFLAVLIMALASMVTPQYAVAQLFTTSPDIVQSGTKNLKIYFHAAQSGKPELINATSLYAHIGVTLTTNPNKWEYVKGDWNSNTDDKRFIKQPDGTWELNIGDIREYFGIKQGDEPAKIAIIARLPSGAGNGYGQTDDFFINITPEGLHLTLDTDNGAATIFHGARKVTFTVNATSNCTLSLSVNGTNIASVNGTRLKATHDFTISDTPYKIVATATNGTETLTEEMEVSCLPSSTQKSYPGGSPRQGAVKNPDGTVTFCIAAPQKSNALLVGAWDNYRALGNNVMNYTDYQNQRYFWVTTSSRMTDDEYLPYYFKIDGDINVADPYARLVLDPYSDNSLPSKCFPSMPAYPAGLVPENTMLAVYRGDIDNYNWDNHTLNFKVPDHRSLTIYEMLLRDFTGDGTDQGGKSFGTFRTALEKLDYIESLGINAVELMPVMEFNGNNSWGYNTNFYMAPDKAYGSPADMRDFVAECHRRGIAVILDIVFNQSDGLAPWYQMYGGTANNPFYNATAPHDYSVLNDWNQDNPLVKQHWKDVLRYWLENYKVDGFRFDLVKGLGSNNSYSGGTDDYNESRVRLMKELHATISEVKPDAIHINELLGTAKEENANGADGQLTWVKISDPSIDYATARPNGNPGNMNGFLASNWNRTIGQTVDYAESHDEPRLASKMRTTDTRQCDATVAYTATHPKSASVKRLGAVAAQMLLTPGSKMIWQFGEIAADDAQGSDLEKLRAIAPKWNQMTNNMRSGLLENYRQLIHLRKQNPELFNGEDATCTLTGFNNSLENIRTIRVTSGNKEIIAFFNPAVSGNAKTAISPAAKLTPENAQLVTASYGTTPTLTSAGGTSVSVKLAPNEFAVYASSTVAGNEEIAPDAISNISLSSYDGNIIISGEYAVATVHTVAGHTIATCYGTTERGIIPVGTGIYLVKVDGITYKVAIR